MRYWKLDGSLTVSCWYRYMTSYARAFAFVSGRQAIKECLARLGLHDWDMHSRRKV